MHHILSASLLPWLDPGYIIHSVGPWALLVVCAIIFAETGLLVGFILPGDTLLILSGLVSARVDAAGNPAPLFGIPVWGVAPLIAIAAILGGQLGYLIGRRLGPRIFERRDSGLFSKENVERTNRFFVRFGPVAVIIARFVPVVRTFAPITAGVGKMDWRRYTLYNVIGAAVWGMGLTVLGWALHFIPPVAHFVESYIDLILLGAVVVTVIPALVHYLSTRHKAQRATQS
ncbi:VTT domain-containing protein [Gryllotalpicola sp.]|uniref:DedA family protein n=1 Tax=Gryllotalpicola sp. TaxID=1932787 RepID=UPI0034348243